MRESTIGTITPSRSSSRIAGSKFDMPSIWPDFIAATAVAPVPTPMIETLSIVSPSLREQQRDRQMLEAEPGEVTPILSPARSLGER